MKIIMTKNIAPAKDTLAANAKLEKQMWYDS